MTNCRTCHRVLLTSIAPMLCLALPNSYASSHALEEVRVTASKTGAEAIQHVPMSVTALNASSLKLFGIRDVQDLTELVPNVTVSQNTQFGQLYIRGIGTNNVFSGGDPSSTIHLDGVYLARPVNVFDELNEIERIEVLRGPQGTLYGRNSTGGTVNVITRKPAFDNVLEVSADLGSYRKRAGSIYANQVLVDNALAANVALSATKRDAYIDNISDSGPDDLNNKNHDAGRVQLLWQQYDALKITLSYDATSVDQSPPIYKPLLVDANGNTPAPVASLKPLYIDGFTKISLSSHDIPGNQPIKPFYDKDASGGNITLDWAINENLSLKSISGYRDFQFKSFLDTDYTEIDAYSDRLSEDQEQASQELHLLIHRTNLNAVIGAFYFRENDTTIARIGLPSVSVTIFGDVETTNQALFADIDYEFAAGWHALAGIRSSYEEKTASGSSDSPVAAFVRNDEKASWSQTSPKIGLQYQANDAAMYYLTATQGFKSGGFNFSKAEAPYDPEKINALEGGAKLQLLEEKLRINFAAFFYDYKNLQVSKFTQNQALDIDNAAAATVKGAELELSLLATEYWHVHLAIAKLSARYDDYTIDEQASTTMDDIDGNYLNSAPQTTIQAGSDYIYSGENVDVGFHANWHWQDKIYFTPQNDAVMSQGAYGLLNASVSIAAKNKAWNIELYGNNVFNKKYTNAAQDFSPLGATIAITDPSTFGVRAFYQYR